MTVGFMAQQPVGGAATNWTVSLKTGSGGEAQSIAASPPTGAAAACTSPSTRTIKVSWTAPSPSTHLTSYTVYDSTTGTPGTYTPLQTGATSPYTTASLPADNYWFEVVAIYASTWSSAYSTATAETTIAWGGTECKVP
ncbi:MAG: hypothetical protein ACLP81_08100 [Acidimicrobiales bacterium]